MAVHTYSAIYTCRDLYRFVLYRTGDQMPTRQVKFTHKQSVCRWAHLHSKLGNGTFSPFFWISNLLLHITQTFSPIATYDNKDKKAPKGMKVFVLQLGIPKSNEDAEKTRSWSHIKIESSPGQEKYTYVHHRTALPTRYFSAEKLQCYNETRRSLTFEHYTNPDSSMKTASDA